MIELTKYNLDTKYELLNKLISKKNKLTHFGVELVKDFLLEIDLDKKVNPYGMGMGTYTNIKKMKKARIIILNGIPVIQVDVLIFDYEDNQRKSTFTKSYIKALLPTFIKYSKSKPTTIRCSKVSNFGEYDFKKDKKW